MEYLAITASILGLVTSLICVLTSLAKIYKPIIAIQCEVKKISELHEKNENKLQDHEERIRNLEIKSSNCGCKK